MGGGEGGKSGRADLNRRPHGPEPCALTGLRYAPMKLSTSLWCLGIIIQRRTVGKEGGTGWKSGATLGYNLAYIAEKVITRHAGSQTNLVINPARRDNEIKET